MLNSVSLNHIATLSKTSGTVNIKNDDVSIKTGALKYGLSVIKSVFKRTENKQTKSDFMSSISHNYNLSKQDLKSISKMIGEKRGTPLSLKDAKGALRLAQEKGTVRTFKQLPSETRGLFQNIGSSQSAPWISGSKDEAPKLGQSDHSQILEELDKHINDFSGMGFGQTGGIKSNKDDFDSDDIIDQLLMDSKSKIEDQGDDVIKMLAEAMGGNSGNDLGLDTGSGKLSPELGHLEGKQDVDDHEIDTNKRAIESDQKLDDELMNLLDDLIEGSNAKLNGKLDTN